MLLNYHIGPKSKSQLLALVSFVCSLLFDFVSYFLARYKNEKNTTLVVTFFVRCVLQILCGWFGVVSVLQAEPHRISNTQRSKNKTTNMVIQQHSRKLLMMDILTSEKC